MADPIIIVDANDYEQGEVVRDRILGERGPVCVEFRCEVTPMFVAGVLRSKVAPMRQWLAENCLTFTGVKDATAKASMESARDRVYGLGWSTDGGFMATCEIVRGDCLEVMRGMASESVDAVVTDPPYGVNYKYNGAFDDSPESWLKMAASVLPEMLRVSRGPVIWFGAATTIDRDRATLRPERTLIWAPKFTLSGSRKDGVFYRWHPIHAWRLGKAFKQPPEESKCGLHSDVLTEPTDAKRSWWNHPATKPIGLMERLVRVAPPGGTVLDPFAGSGTTGVACAKLGRNFIGIELSDEYADIAERRIAEARPLLAVGIPGVE